MTPGQFICTQCRLNLDVSEQAMTCDRCLRDFTELYQASHFSIGKSESFMLARDSLDSGQVISSDQNHVSSRHQQSLSM
jgi:hypothetical protein